MHDGIDLIFTTRAIHAAAIQCLVHVVLKILRQFIQTMDGITQAAIVVTPVIGITIIGIAAAILRSCEYWQAES
jgi:hypothetical protein